MSEADTKPEAGEPAPEEEKQEEPAAKEEEKQEESAAKEEEKQEDPASPPDEDSKRSREEEGEDGEDEAAKKPKTEGMAEPAPIPPSKEGLRNFNDVDVLSGRGGGTNVHPGNRNFRDLINLHRRAYLKARKNDKPAISRAIVRSIRETKGRFLKKDEKTGLWFEIGDDAAREKTSQALRQRAPEMRKLLFDTEREEARAAAEEHLRQQRMMMGMPPPEAMQAAMANMQMPPGAGGNPMAFANPAFFMAAQQGKSMPMPPPNPEAYQQMYAMMGAQMGGGGGSGGAAPGPNSGNSARFTSNSTQEV